jgi:hypothetical protein
LKEVDGGGGGGGDNDDDEATDMGYKYGNPQILST